MPFIYYRTIRLVDTDAAGVIYFARLLSICHEGYEASLEIVGIDLREFFRDSTTAIPIVHGAVDFFRPIFCGDKLEIHLTPQQLSDRNFEITYQILASSTGECLAKAKTRHVCIDLTTRTKIPLSNLICQWLVQCQ